MRALPSFPLLGKELVEQASRRRTYVARCLYGAAVFGLYALVQSQLRSIYANGGFGMLGQGTLLFDCLFWIQLWGIVLLMPALAAGALTQEKEQGTFVLLLLTPMRPIELLLQKWLSRVLVMCGFLILGMPLMAMTYGYGGFAASHLWFGILVLVITAMQIGAFAILVSAWCRSSVAAFLGSYLGLVALYLVAAGCDGLAVFAAYAYQGIGRSFMGTAEADDFRQLMPALVSIVVMLLIARLVIVRRALRASGGSGIGRWFRGMDRLFTRGDAMLGRRRGGRSLPDRDPVAWLEFNRRSLANWRYLIRMLLPVEFVLVCYLSSAGTSGSGGAFSLLLGASLLLLLVLGANLAAGERAAQTIDVLMTTTLTAREIVQQKMRALTRIRWVLCLPMLTVITYPIAFHRGLRDGTWAGAIGELATIALLPALFTWMAVRVGLRVPSRNRAVTIAVAAAALWWLVGSMLLLFVSVRSDGDVGWLNLLIFLTPGALLMVGDLSNLTGYPGGSWTPLAVWLLWHGVLTLWVRRSCLANADRLLARGRVPGSRADSGAGRTSA